MSLLSHFSIKVTLIGMKTQALSQPRMKHGTTISRYVPVPC